MTQLPAALFKRHPRPWKITLDKFVDSRCGTVAKFYDPKDARDFAKLGQLPKKKRKPRKYLGAAIARKYTGK